MPTKGQPVAIGWRSALGIVVVAVWAVAPAAGLSAGDAVAQDLGGQGPANQADSGPDLGTSGHPEIKAAARKAIAAEQQVVAKTRDVFKTGQAPRQTDPAFAPLLDAVFNVSIVRTTEISQEDGDAIAQWLRAAIHVGAVYVRAGTGVTSLSELAANAKAREQSDRNVAVYAPEIGRFIDAEVVLETALLGTVFKEGPEPEDERLRETKDGMRTALEMTIVGVLRTLAVSGAAYDWRLDRLAVLDAAAPQIAKILDPARCAHLRTVAAGIGGTLRDSRVNEKLTAFGDKLSCART